MLAKIIIRNSSKDEWFSSNPLLEKGEMGYENDTSKFKIGNGTDNWNDLPYQLGQWKTSNNLLQHNDFDVLISKNLQVDGNLFVKGTKTILNSKEVTFNDRILTLNWPDDASEHHKSLSDLISGIEVNIGIDGDSTKLLEVQISSISYVESTDTTTVNLTSSSSTTLANSWPSSYYEEKVLYISDGNSPDPDLAFTIKEFDDLTDTLILIGDASGINDITNPTYEIHDTKKQIVWNNFALGAGWYVDDDLHVKGNISSSNSWVSDPDAGIIYYDLGSVGIGTSSPNAPLHSFHATTNTVARFESGDSGVNIRFKDSDSTNEIGIGAEGNDLIVTATSGGERLRVTSDGNVGIGNLNPTSILELGPDPSPEITFNDSSAGDRGSLEFQDGDFKFYSNYNGTGRVSATDNGQLNFIIEKEGNVGIGTTSPSYTLDVRSDATDAGGKISLSNSDASKFLMLLSGQSGDNPAIFWENNQDLRFSTASNRGGTSWSEKMRITSTGKVGIGVTNPVDKFEVEVHTGEALRIVNPAGTMRGYFGRKVGGEGHFGIFDASSNERIHLDSTAHSFFTGAGNVGIGTSNPTEKLHVYTDTSMDHLLLDGTSGIHRGLGFATSGVRRWNIYADNVAEAGSDAGTNFRIARYSDTGNYLGLGMEILRESGNVGIGVGSASEKLQVAGAIKLGTTSSTNAGTIRWTGTDFEGYTGSAWESLTTPPSTGAWTTSSSDIYYNTGNVGIGTSSPNQLLTLGSSVGPSTIGMDFETNGVSRGSILYDANAGNMNFTSGYSGYGGRFIFSANGAERMRIDTSGNIGIGTSSPGQILQVGGDVRGQIYIKGTDSASPTLTLDHTSYTNGRKWALYSGGARAANFDIFDLSTTPNATPRFSINENGNVGIGTTNPEALLTLRLDTGIGFLIEDPAAERLHMLTRDGSGHGYYIGYADGETVGYKLNSSGDSYFIGGDVGVGTSSPDAPLHVDSGSGNLVAKFSSLDEYAYISFEDDGTSTPPLVGAQGDTLRIWTNNSTRLKIDSSGNLTIKGRVTEFGEAGSGASINGSFLSIEGNTDSGGEGSGRLFFREHNSSTAGADNYGFSIGYRGGGTSITTANGGTWTGLTQIGNGEWGFWGHDGNMADVSKGSVIMGGDRTATRVYINPDVGIGTTSPSAKLDVAGEINFSGTRGSFLSSLSQPRIYRSGSESGTYPFDDFGHLILQTRTDGSNRDIVFATGTDGANLTVIDADGSLNLNTANTNKITFNDNSSYLLATGPSENWGIYWNTQDNKIEFHGDGSNKLDIDLDSGNLQVGGTITEGGTALVDKYALKDHIRSLGAIYLNDGSGSSITTSTLISELEGMGAFDSYVSVGKTIWSYAGNDDLTDAGRFQETAGTSFITWSDDSDDTDRGRVTGLFICPTTGASAGKVFIYNDQDAPGQNSYSPGWREVWTNTSDGAGSGLDADLLDGQQGSYYLDYNNLTNTPSSGSSQWTTTGNDIYYNSGNVGIGTTSPGTNLQVKKVSTNAYSNGNVQLSDSILSIFNNPSSEVTNSHATMQFSVSGGTHNRVGGISLVAQSDSTRMADLAFWADDASNRTEKMRITGDGKVGIGTTTPETSLHVDGGSILVNAYDNADTGIFFRQKHSPTHSTSYVTANQYNLSIIAYDHNNSGHRDGLSINGYDGISFCTGSNTRQQRMLIDSAGAVRVNGELYSDGWFRNTGSGEGLFHETNGNHFYSRDSKYWHITSKSDQTHGGLGFYKGHNDGTNNTNRKGFVYWSSTGFGLLDNDGSWAFRTVGNEAQLFYDGSEKLNTTSTGVNITGDLSVSGSWTASNFEGGSFQNNPTVVLNSGFETTGSELSHVVAPEGASYRGGNSETGAIKITLPFDWTNTMMYLKIRIYEYGGHGPGQSSQNVLYGNNSVEIHAAGYAYDSGNTWYQTTAFAHKSGMSMKNVDYNVHFGHDGSKCCIFIGDNSTTWTLPQVIVTDATFGYINYKDEDWHTGWDVSIGNLSTNIDSTIYTGKRLNLYKDITKIGTATGTSLISYGPTGSTQYNGGSIDYIVSGFDNFKQSQYIYYDKLEIYTGEGMHTVLIDDLLEINPTQSQYYRIWYDDGSQADDVMYLWFNTSGDLILERNRVSTGVNNSQFYVYRIDVVKG